MLFGNAEPNASLFQMIFRSEDQQVLIARALLQIVNAGEVPRIPQPLLLFEFGMTFRHG